MLAAAISDTHALAQLLCGREVMRAVCAMLTWWMCIACALAGRLPNLRDDTTCVTEEDSWFHAENHEESLTKWMSSLRCSLALLCFAGALNLNTLFNPCL